MGQGGELNIKLDYLRIGDTRVHLHGQKGGEGDGAMGATVVLTVLFGPLGLLKHGHDMTINKGQELTAYVDSDATLEGGCRGLRRRIEGAARAQCGTAPTACTASATATPACRTATSGA